MSQEQPLYLAIFIETSLLDIYRNLVTMSSLMKRHKLISQRPNVSYNKRKRGQVSLLTTQEKTRDTTYPRDRIRFLAYLTSNTWCDNSIVHSFDTTGSCRE